MEINNHPGSELNNVQETWNENEKRREEERGAGDNMQEETILSTPLERIIQQEANEYDNENKEERLLGGDRASVNDVEGSE